MKRTTGYYLMKQDLFKDIAEYLTNNRIGKTSDIILLCMYKYGIGKVVVMQHLNLLKESGSLILSNNDKNY